MLTIETLLANFLHSFNYVNANNKRNGFLLFSNKKLTQDLENIAIDLKRDLKELILNNNKPQDQKWEAVEVIIKKCFANVKAARFNHAELKRCFSSIPPLSGSEDSAVVDYTYKNPYQPSKFEKEFKAGLEAINIALKKELQERGEEGNQKLTRLKLTCSDLIWNMNHPDQMVIVNDKSYAP